VFDLSSGIVKVTELLTQWDRRLLGAKTENVVKRFQLMYGLSADGIYGPKTKAALRKALK
jgi:peptidoglycan hydrolase-like protein with peptidoglycan-binding domain